MSDQTEQVMEQALRRLSSDGSGVAAHALDEVRRLRAQARPECSCLCHTEPPQPCFRCCGEVGGEPCAPAVRLAALDDAPKVYACGCTLANCCHDHNRDAQIQEYVCPVRGCMDVMPHVHGGAE